MDSASSGVRVPSLREVERKSMMARARRFLDAEVDGVAYEDVREKYLFRVLAET